MAMSTPHGSAPIHVGVAAGPRLTVRDQRTTPAGVRARWNEVFGRLSEERPVHISFDLRECFAEACRFPDPLAVKPAAVGTLP